MKIAVIDPGAGVAGDMLLGALVDAGLDEQWLRALPELLGLNGVTVDITKVSRSSIAAVKVTFGIPGEGEPEAHIHVDGADEHVHDSGHHHHHGRHLSEMLEIIEAGKLPAEVRESAVRTFRALGDAEARVHGLPVERVHFHEVGGLDAILDVVGVCGGLHELGVEAVYNTAIGVGRGWFDAAHGRLPVPAPATGILLEGMELDVASPATGEAATPTGVALLKGLSKGAPPDGWRPTRTGWGAGTRDPEDYPNAVRVMLGELAEESAGVVVLTSDMDDMDPEYLGPLRGAMEAAGALEVAIWSTMGKKGRLGTRVEAVCRPEESDAVAGAMLKYSTTAGVRRHVERRDTLERGFVTVTLDGFDLRVKFYGASGERYKAEFDEVVAISERTGAAPLEVARRAEALAREARRRS